MEYSIFGCRLNKYYLNQWLEYFRSHDCAINPYMIASCEVTDRAKQKWLKLAQKKLAWWCHIYLTWCGSLKRWETIWSDQFYELYPELRSFSDSITLLPEAPINSEFSSGCNLGRRNQNSELKNNIYTKKFVVVQTGCDNYCSFCLTVQKRGAHQSRNIEEILEEVRNFESLWGREIVLTGVNIAAWWCSTSRKPEESKFTSLLKHILEYTQIARIRLSSLGPEYLDDEFFTVIENPRIMPHFHLSIQSFSDWVLQRMRRNYSLKNLKTILKKFRAVKTSVPLSLWADIIVGFPGETEDDFLETLENIKKFMINKVHAFPFSDHHIGETIPASLLSDQVDAVTKKGREQEIKKIADALAEEFYQLNRWITHNVLVEGKWSGWTENYIKVPVDSKYKRGEVIEFRM